MATREQWKAHIRERGLWKEFLSIRQDAKDKGLEPREANKRAFNAVLPNGWEKKGSVIPDGAPKTHDAEVAARILEAADAPGGGSGVASGVGAGVAIDASLVAVPDKRSVIEDMKWVYDNMAVVNPAVEAAPSPGAIGLLNWATANSLNRTDFYKMWSKLIPSKARLDAANADDHQTDGDRMLDFVEDVMKHRDIALGIVVEEEEVAPAAISPEDF